MNRNATKKKSAREETIARGQGENSQLHLHNITVVFVCVTRNCDAETATVHILTERLQERFSVLNGKHSLPLRVGKIAIVRFIIRMLHCHTFQFLLRFFIFSTNLIDLTPA